MSVKKVSDKTKEEAFKIAKGTQRPNQTKEQTKLIAKGIEKGIEQYKKQHKEKLRQADRNKKKKVKTDVNIQTIEVSKQPRLAWWLLAISNLAWLIALILFIFT